jgi:transcriptional regulator with XRE-family HTH domain
MPPDAPPALLGVIVRARRRERRLTQAELARLVGVTAQTISNLERGETERVNGATLARLAGALGVSEVELDANRLAGSVTVHARTLARRSAIKQLLELPENEVEEILADRNRRAAEHASPRRRSRKGRR